MSTQYLNPMPCNTFSTKSLLTYRQRVISQLSSLRESSVSWPLGYHDREFTNSTSI